MIAAVLARRLPLVGDSNDSTPTMATTKLSGTFTQIIHSPKGGVEGLLLLDHGKAVQLVVGKDDEQAQRLVGTLRTGQQLVVSTDELPPSNKGAGVHPVRALVKVLSVDAVMPRKIAKASAAYAGAVVRLNYAKHGAPNGVVLDSGDFIHTKPDGFAKLKLKVGDKVEADGDAHFLATGGGWAVEATTVNGKKLK